MAKMWAGRTNGITEKEADDFNSSLSFDKRMYKEDIVGSMAHAAMLGVKGIIEQSDADILIDGLSGILIDIENGDLVIGGDSEDIHMFVEEELTKRLGDVGKKLHTARSRNDQVALDLRLNLINESYDINENLKALIGAITDLAEKEKETVMPGYTHLQRAQPITFAHHILAYAMMLLRDKDRIADWEKRAKVSPIGSCALAGTTFDTDRFFEADRLDMISVCQNSIDGVSDRDFAVELLSDISLIMMHLSRFAEEIVLWSSWEFKFVELSDAYTTGSSIMPQKKNSDMAELIRGKTGRVYGDLISLLTVLKGLPLAYNKDMQEDKESVFDAVDTVKKCLNIFTGMVKTVTVNRKNMLNAAQKGFINATDLADYLTKKDMPFRTAYKISGEIVAECIKDNLVLETYPLERYKAKSDLFEADIYNVIDLKECVNKRNSFGGTSVKSVETQIEFVRDNL